jgi:hypothetical protein
MVFRHKLLLLNGMQTMMNDWKNNDDALGGKILKEMER